MGNGRADGHCLVGHPAVGWPCRRGRGRGVTQGGNLGIVVVSVCALAVATVIVVLARRNQVTARNVNEAKTVQVIAAVQTGGDTDR